MRGSLFWWIVALWFWLAPPSAALAEPAGVVLEWERPPGSTCPPAAVLQQDVEQALGRRVFTSAQAARLRVRGIIEDRASAAHVRLEARSLDGTLLGTRELEAKDCAALRTDLSLVLTLLVERDVDTAEGSASSTLRLDVGLWAAMLLNTLPRETFGGGPVLSLDLGSSVQLQAAAAYWLPVAIETAAGIRADIHAASAAVRVCPRIAASAQDVWQLRVCGGVQLGASITLQTHPQGVGPQLRLLAQALGELRGTLRVGRASRFELAVGPIVSMGRTSIFSVQSDNARVFLYRPPIVGMILSLAFVI